MTATATPKRPRTARQQRTEQGVLDIRIVGYDPRLADGVGDTGGGGGAPPEPPEPPRPRRGRPDPSHWGELMLIGIALLAFALLGQVLDELRRKGKEHG